jgi:hypothetical protein
MMLALGYPLFFAVVFEFEHSRRDDSMHDASLYLSTVLYLALQLYVD